MYSLNIKGRLIEINTPLIMGILNLTEDSFYDGGKFFAADDALRQIDKIVQEGADIIDIGASTTKPGSKISHPNNEIEKLSGIIEYITQQYPEILISIDTYHHEVADFCINAGAHIINDISGGLIDEKIFSIAAQHQVPIILMHIQGTPETMQIQPTYNNLIQEVIQQLNHQINKAIAAGVKDIIIDPGFGFGKTLSQNFELFNQLNTFQLLGKPLLVGISRKSMIWKTLETTPQDALTGTIALNMLALKYGANILRVHDVKEAVETVKIHKALKPNK
ncbi:MAG: dihydropteroate synthase [Chitinophagales bacterium]|nr:dihydropteroate synthase [Chitinophagales bacterium]